MKRCTWATSELSIRYHDEEWGVPLHDDQRFFEMLILEGAQAGLSWETVLRKRDAYRIAFDGFSVRRVARYDDAKLADLLQNPGIIRNRLKIAAARTNARAFLEVQQACGSFDDYIWGFVNGIPVLNHPYTSADLPASTTLSETISRDLKKRGFTFVGSTIIYAFMQATGIVNDHVRSCFRAKQTYVK